MNTKEKIANYSRERGVIEVKSEALSLVRSDQSPDESQEEDLLELGPSLDHSVSMYGAWREFLATTGPYSHMWTHSYIHPYGDRKAIDGLWDCTRYINRAIWGPRWSKKSNGLQATVIAERHKLSLELRGRLHFHVLVRPTDSGISDQRFSEVVNRATLWLKDGYRQSMASTDRTDIRQVYDPEGLATYLAKDLRTPHWPNGENIFFIRPGGIEGVVFQLKSSGQLTSLH